MSGYELVHGYIIINQDYENSIDYIKKIGKDESYPFINSNMFSIGDNEIPYYYGNIILSFAATYKEFGLELDEINKFIIKIENILRNIDFEKAQFHCEGFYSDFIPFWINRNSYLGKKIDESYPENNENLIQTNEWYFGFKDGGWKFKELEDFYDFKYPIFIE